MRINYLILVLINVPIVYEYLKLSGRYARYAESQLFAMPLQLIAMPFWQSFRTF